MSTPEVHCFEKAGLGLAPFYCVGVASIPSSSLAASNPAAYNNAMNALPKGIGCGSCAYCGTAIMHNFIIKSTDDRRFVVGCDCVAKTGDLGLVKQVRAERLRVVQEKRAAVKALKRSEREAVWAAERAVRAETFKTEYAALIKRAEPYMDVGFIQSVIERGLAGGFMSDRALAALERVVADQEARTARRANSRHTGTVGKRQKFTATVVRVSTFTRPRYASYGDEVVYIVSMSDTEGNTIVSKSASFGWDIKKGDVLTFKATVKAHDEYLGERQTVIQRLTRC